jgi:hypothetical protein
MLRSLLRPGPCVPSCAVSGTGIPLEPPGEPEKRRVLAVAPREHVRGP